MQEVETEFPDQFFFATVKLILIQAAYSFEKLELRPHRVTGLLE